MKNSSALEFTIEYKPDHGALVELKNGKFVDVVKANYFDPNARVVLKEGRIEAICGLEGQSSGLRADVVIDLQGKTVMPGLVNTHCHTTQTSPSLLPDYSDVKLFEAHADKQIQKNLTECLYHGITNIRDAWAADLRKTRRLQKMIQQGVLMGPRIMQTIVVGPPGGYLTEKQGPVMKWTRSKMGLPPIDYALSHSGSVLFGLDASEQQVRDAVNRAIDERGAEAIKIGEQKENMTNFKPDATIMTLDQLTAIADQARKRNLKSTIHHTSLESFRRALKAGVSSMAHVPGDGLVTNKDTALFVSQNCILEPTMSVPYDTAYKIKGHPSHDNPLLTLLTEFRNRAHDGIVEAFWIPEFKAAARKHHAKLAKEKMSVFGVLPMKKMFKHFATFCITGARNLKLLYEKDAKITAANDGGVPPCTPAMLQHEMDLLELFLNRPSGESLFHGADAVRMATIHGAECLGIDKDFGSIEVGKVADLVVVDGDPFEDHRVVGCRVAALFKDGKLVINNCQLDVTPPSKKKN